MMATPLMETAAHPLVRSKMGSLVQAAQSTARTHAKSSVVMARITASTNATTATLRRAMDAHPTVRLRKDGAVQEEVHSLLTTVHQTVVMELTRVRPSAMMETPMMVMAAAVIVQLSLAGYAPVVL